MTRISVIGAGAWGTSLAQVYATAGHETILWAREKHLADALLADRENKTYLPGFAIDERLGITNDLALAAQSDIILNVTPAQYVRANLKLLSPLVHAGQSIVICAKGIEIDSGKFLSEAGREECPQTDIAILTGPTFAHEIMAGSPSAATIASGDSVHADRLCAALTSRNLRLYKSTDMIGAQAGGAIKNVIAIACGIVGGLGLGESARAALVTRGLAEIARFAVAFGGRRETLMGQCGVGDLMLTCSSIKSRNYSLGFELGQGRKLADILAERNSVTEGVHTAQAAAEIAKKRDIDMPIVNMVCACLHDNLDPQDAFARLMDRPSRAENE